MTEPADFTEQFRVEWVHLLDQSISRIRHCVRQLTPDQVWWSPGPGQNSIGMLLQHIAGNAKQWIVAGITERPDNRNRQAEFDSGQQTSPEQLIQKLCQVVSDANKILMELNLQDYGRRREIQGFETTVLGAIMHAIPHFVGHTHQIVQLTRMQLGDRYEFQWNLGQPRTDIPL